MQQHNTTNKIYHFNCAIAEILKLPEDYNIAWTRYGNNIHALQGTKLGQLFDKKEVKIIVNNTDKNISHMYFVRGVEQLDINNKNQSKKILSLSVEHSDEETGKRDFLCEIDIEFNMSYNKCQILNYCVKRDFSDIDNEASMLSKVNHCISDKEYNVDKN